MLIAQIFNKKRLSNESLFFVCLSLNHDSKIIAELAYNINY
jgi:hypothetical protein